MNKYHYVHILGFVSVRILIILVVRMVNYSNNISNEFLEKK